ncbi:hypothetical protein J6590_045004 [Homalodisca vitripennis]|nr:hypothetical protein J6590_045004 [Homalodisca vitripennis]
MTKAKKKLCRRNISFSSSEDEDKCKEIILCDDNEMDDVDLLSFGDSGAISGKELPTEAGCCLLCGEFGRDNELWFRCGFCAGWVHAECSAADSVENFVHAGVVSYQEIVEKNTKNSQTRVVRINATYLHPDYKCCESLVNDFGLLQIKPKFNLTDTVSTTNLAGKPLGSEKDICILAGYGAQKGQMFGKLKIHKISSKRLSTHKECPCKWTKRKIWSVSSPKKTKDYLCRINQEDDQPLGYGDYGAAIMKSKRVYGVFSSILHESFHKSCSLKMFSREEILIHSKTEKLTTAVFSDTCRYVNWINKYTHSLNLEDIDSDCGNRGRLLSPSVLTTVLVFLNILILLMQN